jgi:3-oxoacyl-[acyl-carrier protein] reductase/meso-butanediol dehydrogenase/(S,S)-butanediol dehydrogenase/diacetyl reductase
MSKDLSHEIIVKIAMESTGRLDLYVNNAGFSEWRALERIDEPFLQNIFATNTFGYFYGCKAAAASMTSGACIINVSSIAGKRGSANNSAYSASKFAITGLTQSLAKELGSRGIRVNAICPVLISTPGLMEALENSDSPAGSNPHAFFETFIQSQSALQSLPDADDVANLCLFLASEQAKAITGQSFNVDCGVLPS